MNLFEHAENNIKTEIETLRAEINRHNELYYQKDAPEIADAEFDALLARLKKLEEENPEFITPDSPTQRVGGRAEGFKPFVHRVPLMSLDNSYDLDDLKAFDERCRKLADGREFDYVAELKIDGLSVALHYENGVSDGGRDARRRRVRATMFSATSKRFDDSFEVKRRFSRTGRSARRSFYGAFGFRENQRRTGNAGRKNFTPTRAISLRERCGNSIRQSSRRGGWILFPYDVLSGNQKMFATHWEIFDGSKRAGFNVNPNRALCENFDEAGRIYQCRCRQSAIRSITILTAWSSKSIQTRLQEEFGATTKAPRWAIAYKYPAMQATTQLERDSRSGRQNRRVNARRVSRTGFACRNDRRARVSAQRRRNQTAEYQARRLRFD